MLYKKILKACSTFEYYESNGYENKLTLTFKEILDKWDAFTFIYNSTIKWVSFGVSFNNKPIYEHAKQAKLLSSIVEIKRNLGYKEESVDKDSYCLQGWGCRLLKSITYEPHYYARRVWYDCGEFVDGKWIIRKDQIKLYLKKEAEDLLLTLCPNFRWERVESAVDNLPSFIDIANKQWEISTRVQFIDGVFKSIPTGIRWTGEYNNFSPEDIARPQISDILDNLSDDDIKKLIEDYLKNDDNEK